MNTLNFKSFKVGGGETVWTPPIEKIPLGGYLDLDKYPTRPFLIPAGSMVSLPLAGGIATIITADMEAEELAKVNYMTQDDIYLEQSTKYATVTCLFKGVCYASVAPDVPVSVRNRLTQIKFVDYVAPVDDTVADGEGGE